MGKLVLAVDGDTIAYRTAAVCNDAWAGACDDIIASTLKKISTASGIHDMRIYLSGEDNFRYKVAKTKPYKGNRVGMVHPQFLNHCKQHLVDVYDAIRMDGYEADDGIATDMMLTGAVHCGVDKDILQIPGRHYMYVKEEWITVTPDDAAINLYRQVLMGDTSDNIPGIPGCGTKTAEKLITDPDSAFSDALNAYLDKCPAKGIVNVHEYFNEQLQLVAMISNCDIGQIEFDLSVYVEPDTDGFAAVETDEVFE
jgi:DNA polymerase-1